MVACVVCVCARGSFGDDDLGVGYVSAMVVDFCHPSLGEAEVESPLGSLVSQAS